MYNIYILINIIIYREISVVTILPNYTSKLEIMNLQNDTSQIIWKLERSQQEHINSLVKFLKLSDKKRTLFRNTKYPLNLRADKMT